MRHPRGRAWIELNRAALEQNVRFLRSRLPERCKLMPAVKADAYGHGMVHIAGELNRLGIDAFCVACASEGVTLRKHGIKGEILVLGYTHPQEFPLLRRHRLSQTVVDYAYATALNQYDQRMHVHIGIDTGMHRLGERYENIDRLCMIRGMENLTVDGLFTHLSSADGPDQRSKDFTHAQAKKFFDVVGEMEARGFDRPKLHVQASYGVLNYPDLAGDYARVGIALYGVLSTKEDMGPYDRQLRPVLSLKARVAAVKRLNRGETAGYGQSFTADRDMTIAVISAGYADGIPRCMSGRGGCVLIEGRRAPIIGWVCMDQTIVDVSAIPAVQAGDVAVFIGKSGDDEITACDVAAQSDTIANEILSRLGARLERIVI